MPKINLHICKSWILDWKLILLWILSLTILIFSFHQQYIKKIEPCFLCKYQRLIYFSVFIISSLGLICDFNSFIKNALKITFLIGFSLSIYHILIQSGWINDRCAINENIENMNDFIRMLEQPKIACATISWQLFGFSASVYNALFSLCALITLKFKKIKRTPYA
jgi:disulfide bond formation protein DsbB